MGVPTVRSLVAGLGQHLAPVDGFDAPDAPISAVHISELPDPTAYLSGGELLLTTGLSLASDEHGWAEYVSRLAEVGVVALGFGLGPVHVSLPVALVAACRTVDVPLLTVPAPTPFVTISRAYWSAVARSGEARLTDRLAAQRSLIDAAASDDPALAILRTLSTWLPGWAATLSASGEVLQAYPSERTEEMSAVGRDLQRLPAAGARSTLSVVSDGRHVVAYPFASAGRRVHYLAVGASRRLDPTTRHTVVAAAELLSLVASRAAIDDAARSTQLSAVASLLEAGHVSAARHLCLTGGLDIPGEEVRILAVGTGVGARIGDAVAEWSRPYAQKTVDGQHLWLLLPVDVPPASELADQLSRIDPAATASLSAAVPLEQINDELLRRLGSLHTLRPGQLDLRAADPDDVGARLARLTQAPFREALDAYLRHRGRWDAAARTLGVHRNTLRYRVGRARELLDVDIDDPDVSARLWFALRGHPQA